MSRYKFTNKVVDSVLRGSAHRLPQEAGFSPVRAGICRFFAKEWHEQPFVQPHYALVYCVKGVGQFLYPDGRRFPFYPGCIIQRFPGLKHTLILEGNQELIWAFMAVPASSLEIIRINNLCSEDQPVINYKQSDEVVVRYQSIINAIRQCPELKIASLITEMQQFAIDMLYEARHLSKDAGNDDLINQACEILRNRLDKRIDMKTVAESLNLGYSKFRKLFTDTLKVSPAQYRINYRIEKACELLSSSDSSVEFIASVLGYADTPTFSKQFKKVTGKSPRGFREMGNG